ncbi:hypothetical protein TNCV_3457281 [Trichonephila clavipes]|nr:hypothetical protein TNCV_3457281 [Trichonephila clavipes]
MSDISDISDLWISHRRDNQKSQPAKSSGILFTASQPCMSSISEGARTPIKKNSFLELYQMTSFDLAKKKTRCRKKEPLSETPRKSEISPLNGLKREFPSLTLLAARVPNQVPIDDKKKILPMDSLVKIVTTPQT